MKISVFIFLLSLSLISPVSVTCRNNCAISYFCGNGEPATIEFMSPVVATPGKINDAAWLHLPAKSLQGIVQKKIIYVLGLGIGFPVVVLFILNICARLICVFRDDHHGLIDSNAAGLHQSTNMLRQPFIDKAGLDKSIIKSYSTILVGKDILLPNPHGTICSICISEYRPTEIVKTLSVCNHYFHAQCIDQWLSMNLTCPVCRMSQNHDSLLLRLDAS